MVRFQIPKAYLPGFEAILALSLKQVNSIVTFLKTVPVGTGPRTFSELFSTELDKDLNLHPSLPSTIFSLGSFKSNEGEVLSLESLVKGLVVSFGEQYGKSYLPEQLTQLEQNLLQILSNSQQLSISYKAFNLLAENSRLYREGHVVTDIRLLFKETINEAERHGLILHQLKVESEEGGDNYDYYFSLSHNDLLKLKEQITRAIEKERIIREQYGTIISFIDLTD